MPMNKRPAAAAPIRSATKKPAARVYVGRKPCTGMDQEVSVDVHHSAGVNVVGLSFEQTNWVLNKPNNTGRSLVNDV